MEMASPSSSATPSPPMAHYSAAVAAPPAPESFVSTSSSSSVMAPRTSDKQSVQKFLATAELSSVTRALRARLSQASWKAAHTGSQPHDFDPSARTSNSLKRKAPGSGGYYHTSSINSPSTSARRPAEPPRNHYPNYDPTTGAPTGKLGPGASLFTSILAPPIAKQTRTIMNASDPPIAAPVRPAPSPRAVVEHRGARTIAGPSARDKGKKAAVSPELKRSSTRSRKGGEKRRRLSAPDVDADGDVDMRAAATLTSLLYQHRPSVSGSAGSPRSSVDADESASNSFSQFVQSSARTINPAPTATATPLSARSSVGSSSQQQMTQSQTPPPPVALKAAQKQQQQQRSQTKKPAQPNDNEAADLMLFLATSPSPARLPHGELRDPAALRALGGGTSSVRSKGRVLFPGPGTATASLSRASSRDTSFTTAGAGSPRRGSAGDNTPAVPSPMRASSSASSLLPPLPNAIPGSPLSGNNRDAGASIPRPSSAGDFNFNEYINASPTPNSPARGGMGTKTNLGLRADVGRKLFEEEQMRMSMKGQGQNERALEAGIDLVK